MMWFNSTYRGVPRRACTAWTRTLFSFAWRKHIWQSDRGLPMKHIGTIAAVVTLVAAIAPAQAEVKNVKISMDWIIQGTHAPFFIAQDQGYFKTAGVTVDAIDKGNGATNVAVTVASGAYQFGWVDMPSMILFNAKNPSTPLIAVYVSFDTSPLAFITRKSAGIRKPADLEGKKIAGGPAPPCTTPPRSCSRRRTPAT